jgi:peptide methionine sulfoxide reductase msrA/msrB
MLSEKELLMKIYRISALTIALIINLIIYSTGMAMEKRSATELTAAETRVIVNKGTEPPFSGIYNDFFKTGTYCCKRCKAPLYRSNDKFKSTCGWPSFDDEIKGSIKKELDADGFRTEILCANCGAHLGHIFAGEQLTDKNIRHCVNSVSLIFIPDTELPSMAKAYFAGGCFWGMEYLFEHKDGVISATSGYMGGSLSDPSYRDVTSGETGHLETVEIIYNPAEVSYEELAKFFFEIHDPTQTNGQGPDIGSQYLSAVFFQNNSEKETVQKLIDMLNDKGYDIATRLIPAQTFWTAEDYHQNHYDRNQQKPYCHIYKKKF